MIEPKSMIHYENTVPGIFVRRVNRFVAEVLTDGKTEKVHIKNTGRLKELLGDKVYSDEDDTLEATVGRLLKASGKTLSVAESCTGGEISHLITSVPGSSAYYLGSVTSYAVSVKEKVLGVPAETVEKYGVVSGEVAAAMAEGVRRVTGSDYAGY